MTDGVAASHPSAQADRSADKNSGGGRASTATRQRVIVVAQDTAAIQGLLRFLAFDHEIISLPAKEGIFSQTDLGACRAVIIGQPPFDMPIKDFCDRMARRRQRPELVIVIERPDSPWAAWTAIAENHAVVSGLIRSAASWEHQVTAFRLLASQTGDRRIESLSPAAKAIWKQAKETLNSLTWIVRSGEPLPRTAVRELAMTVVDQTEEGALRDVVGLLRDHHNETVVHSLDLAITTLLLGRHIGIRNKADQHHLFEIGLLHDIGKLAMPLAVLQKPGALNTDELAVMRTHPLESERILRSSGEYDDLVVNGAVQHHEKLDGTGYPYGLPGEKLSEIGRMLAVCDVYCALTERRSYKPQLTADEAFAIIRRLSGHHLDPLYIDRLAEMVFGHAHVSHPEASHSLDEGMRCIRDAAAPANG